MDMTTDSQSLNPLIDALVLAWTKGATHVHFLPNQLPVFRRNGRFVEIDGIKPIPPETFQFVLANKADCENIDNHGEWRARLQILKVSKHGISNEAFTGSVPYILATLLPHTPHGLESLKLPVESIKYLKNTPSGIILVAGPGNSGRTSTQSSLVCYFGRRFCETGAFASKIGFSALTIEKPIEYVLTIPAVTGTDTIPAILHQVSVGIDTEDWSEALENASKGDYNLIMTGDVLPIEGNHQSNYAFRTARLAATGKIVVTGTSAVTPGEAVHKICNTAKLAHEAPDEIRLFLQNLRAIIVQDIVRVRTSSDVEEVRPITTFYPIIETTRNSLIQTATDFPNDLDRFHRIFKSLVETLPIATHPFSKASSDLSVQLKHQVRIKDF